MLFVTGVVVKGDVQSFFERCVLSILGVFCLCSKKVFFVFFRVIFFKKSRGVQICFQWCFFELIVKKMCVFHFF